MSARTWVRSDVMVPLALGLGLGLGIAVQPKLAVLGVVGLGVAFLGVTRPVSLVAMMFLGMLFDRLGVTGMKLGAFPVTASKLSVLGGLGLWSVHAVITGARPVRWHPVLSAMLGVIGVTSVTIVVANSLTLGKFTLYGMMMMMVMVGLVYAVLADAKLRPLYSVLAVALALAVMASLRGAAGRATGTMGDPNEWATCVLLLTPLVLGGLADDPSWHSRVLRIGLLLLAPVGILRTESRTALVVGLISFPGWIYILRRHRGDLAACAVAALVAAPFVVDVDTALLRFRQLMQNLQGAAVVRDQSLEERSELFRQGKQLFYDHWFVGAGPGNFSTATGFISQTGSFRPAHNTYLEIAAEQGVVGLLPVVIFIGTVAVTLRQAYRASTRPSDQNRVLGVAMGLAALSLMAATLGLLTFSMAYLVLGFGLAVAHQAGGAHVV